jgi:hypothetical protein
MLIATNFICFCLRRIQDARCCCSLAKNLSGS